MNWISRLSEWKNIWTQADIAKKVETPASYVNKLIRRDEGVVNNTYVKMLEALGYDIELHYVKREE